MSAKAQADGLTEAAGFALSVMVGGYNIARRSGWFKIS